MQSMCNSFVIEEKERWILLNPEPQTQRHRTSLFFYIDCSNQHRKREKNTACPKVRREDGEQNDIWRTLKLLKHTVSLLSSFPAPLFSSLSLSLAVFHFYFTASRRMQCYNLNHPPKTDRSINSWIRQGVFFFQKYASKLLNEYIFWLIWYFSIKKTINYSLSSGCWASMSLDEWNLVFKGTIC